jgi:hypothetical protein
LNQRYSASGRLLNNRIMKRIFIHPITFVSLAALLLIKAIVFGQLVLVLGVAPFLYLAWHFRDPALRQGVLRAGRRRPPARIQQLIQVCGLVGLAAGSVSGYWQFVRIGWDPLSALMMSAAVMAFGVVVMWSVLRAVWGPKESAGA